MKKLLIVDDDPQVLRFSAQVAESLEYQVLTAKDGLEALICYAENPQIDALITDIRMPGVDGLQLALELRARNPEIPILFISGYADEPSILAGLREMEAIQFLPKPFSPQQLGTGLLLLFAAGAEAGF